MAPGWLPVIAWLYLSACFCCAGIIAYDIGVNHRPQPMGVMNAVYPITALYFGPLALALYWQWERATRGTAMPMSLSRTSVSNAAGASGGDHEHLRGGAHTDHDQARPRWVTIAIEVSHCGSGCARWRARPGDDRTLANPPPKTGPGLTAAVLARPPGRRADGMPPGGGQVRRACRAACRLGSGLRLPRLVPLDLVLGDPALVQAGVGLDQLDPRPDRDRLGQCGAFLPGREAAGSGGGRGHAAPARFLAAVVLRSRRDAVSRHSAHAMTPVRTSPLLAAIITSH